MTKSRIDKGLFWSKSWSLIEGCSPVSESCRSCWSANESHMRSFQKNPKIREQYEGLTYLKDGIPTFNGIVRFREDCLDIPLREKRPTIYAIWNDLFHEKVPADFITATFDVMEYYKQHTFLVFTKRPERIEPVLFGQEGYYYLGGGDYMPNVWLGTTAENQEMADKRIPVLIRGTDQFKKFLSFEPLLSDIDFRSTFWGMNLAFSSKEIDWVVVGAESGAHRRLCNIEWIRSIVRQCKDAGVPVFVKQIHDERGRIVKNINLFPEDLRVRELPWK